MKNKKILICGSLALLFIVLAISAKIIELSNSGNALRFTSVDVEEKHMDEPSVELEIQQLEQSGADETQRKKTTVENRVNVLLNGETITLSADDLKKAVADKSYTGNGYLLWDGWRDIKKNGLLSGQLDVSLIADPVYTSMKLPSDSSDIYMSYRKNASIIDNQLDGYTKACGLGAFYPVYGEKLPKQFNLCVGKFMVFVLKKDTMQWEVFTEKTVLDDIKNTQLRRMPWDSDFDLKDTRPTDKTVFHDTYVEFKLKASDLGQTEENPDGSVIHVYTEKLPIDSSNILGTVVIFETWSDTAGIDNKIIAVNGLDYWGNGCHQMFFGRGYYLTNEHQTIIGHNIPDSLYKQLVEAGNSPEKCLEVYNNTK